MTEIAVTTSSFLPGDRPWLLFSADSVHGPVPTWSGVLDLSLFTANTHYPNGFIQSGVALGKVTSGGKLGPYDNTASDGRQTLVGFLYNPLQVTGKPLDRMVSEAYVDCFAVIWESRLPSGHGLDAAGKAELPLIKFRA